MRLAEVLTPHAPDSLLSRELGTGWATTVVLAKIGLQVGSRHRMER